MCWVKQQRQSYERYQEAQGANDSRLQNEKTFVPFANAIDMVSRFD
jgi:hypothetical protein